MNAQTASKDRMAPHARAAAVVRPVRLGLGLGLDLGECGPMATTKYSFGPN